MIDWLTSDTGTWVFFVGLMGLYIGFLIGLLGRSWVDQVDDDGGGGEDVPDYPPDNLDGRWDCRSQEEHDLRVEAGLFDCDCASWV